VRRRPCPACTTFPASPAASTPSPAPCRPPRPWCRRPNDVTNRRRSEPEPAGPPARAALLLIGAQLRRGPVVDPDHVRAGEEIDVDPADAPGAELDIAGAGPGVRLG